MGGNVSKAELTLHDISSQHHTFTLVVVLLFVAAVNSRQSLQAQLPST